MSDYIERERAMDIFGDVPGWRGYYEPFTFNIHQAVTGIVKVVREEMSKIPAADVAPMVHGHFVHGELMLLAEDYSVSMFFNAIALADFLADARGMIAPKSNHDVQKIWDTAEKLFYRKKIEDLEEKVE